MLLLRLGEEAEAKLCVAVVFAGMEKYEANGTDETCKGGTGGREVVLYTITAN